MITGACLSYFIKSIRIASFFGTIPYSWSDETMSLHFVKSKYRKVLWLLLLGVHLCYTIFVIVRFIQYASISIIPSKLIHAFWIVLHTVGVVSELILLCKYHKILYLINGYIGFELSIKRNNFFNFRKTLEDSNPLILILNLMSQISSPLIFPMLYWLHPESPQFPGSLIKIDCPLCFSSILIKICFYIFEFLMMTTLVGNVYFCCTVAIMGPRCILCYLTFIRFVPNPLSNTDRIISIQMKLYRQIQILTAVFNDSLADTLIPCLQFQGGSMIVLSLYGTLMFYSLVGMPAYSVFPMCLISSAFVLSFVLESSGKLIQNSKCVTKCWRKSELILCRKKIWLRYFAKSCRPVAVRTGSLYFIKRDRSILLLRLCIQRAVYLMVYFDT